MNSFFKLAYARGLSFRPGTGAEAGKALRIEDQTFRQAARLDGGMYHILASQRQAQFGAGQAFNHHAFQLQPMRGGVQFALAVGGAVEGLDQHLRRLWAFQRAQHIVEAQHQRAGTARDAEIAQHAASTSAFSARAARSAVAVTCALAAREKSFFSTALATASRRRFHPEAPARQLGRHIGHHHRRRDRRQNATGGARAEPRPRRCHGARASSSVSSFVCAPPLSSGFSRLLAFAAFFSDGFFFRPAPRSSRP